MKTMAYYLLLTLFFIHSSVLRAAETDSQPAMGLANPASVYCHEMGGTLEIKGDENGNQYGLCHLPNGQVCEEWALFRDKVCEEHNLFDQK